MWIIFVILIIALAALIFISNRLVNTVIHVRRLRMEDCISQEEEKGNISLQWYENLHKDEFNVKSQHGYDLYMQLIKHPEVTKKTIIIVHGFGFNLVGSIKYSRIFYDMGYNVVIYDHCNCGRSGGDMTTMGYREKDDLKTIVQYTQSKLGEDIEIGIHGESMGASTALLYAADKPGLSFVIEDCGYSDLTEELTYQLKARHNLPYFPIIPIASLICKLRAGFYFSEVSPARDIADSKIIESTPILFIHGSDDKFTLPYMMDDLYESKKGFKRKYVAQGAEHARSFVVDKEKYISVVKDFLEEIGFASNS